MSNVRFQSRTAVGGRVLLKTLSAATAVTVLTASFAVAQVIVVQSNVPGLAAGSTLQNDATISIPAGKSALVVLPSGRTRTVAGPFNGKAADLTRGTKANPDLLAAIQRYVQTGGADSGSVGATRSFAPRNVGGRASFSWNSVPITASGDYCVERGKSVFIERTNTDREQTVTLVELTTKRRAQVFFPVGVKRVAWPTDDLALDPRSNYAIIMQGSPMRRLRLRLLAPLPAHEDTLQVLHGQRCEVQFRAYLQQLQQIAARQ